MLKKNHIGYRRPSGGSNASTSTNERRKVSRTSILRGKKRIRLSDAGEASHDSEKEDLAVPLSNKDQMNQVYQILGIDCKAFW